MKLRVAAASIVLLAACTVASAQDSAPVVGKWSGNYTTGANNSTVRVVLDIQNVEGEKVKGRGSVHSSVMRGQGCSGEFPIEGTFKDSTLRVRATEKFGAAGDCTFALAGTVEGGKLLAKRAQNEFVMTK